MIYPFRRKGRLSPALAPALCVAFSTACLDTGPSVLEWESSEIIKRYTELQERSN